jgi:predicted DNA-binding protein with PD1-like motif
VELIRIGERGDLVEQLAAELAARGIANAAVVSIVGAVRSATLQTMVAADPKTPSVTEVRNAEVAGVGEVVDGVPNLHVTLGVEGGRAFAGHLSAATVGGWAFVNVYVIPA